MRPYLAVLLSSLVLIAGTNGYIDPGHTGLRRLGALPRAWDSDEVLLLPENFDARILRREHLELLPKADTLILGSSRSMLFSREDSRQYNASMPAASLEDLTAFWELQRVSGKTPGDLVLDIDPWMFNRGYKTERWKSQAPLYFAFLARRSPLPAPAATLQSRLRSLRETAWLQFSRFCDLLSLDVLKGSLRALKTDRGSALTAPKGLTPVIVARAAKPADRMGWRADGVTLFPDADEAPRTAGELARLSENALVPGNFPMFADYSFDPDAEARLLSLVSDARAGGARVTLIYPPFHPELARRMGEDARLKDMIPESLQALERVATATGAGLCAKMDLSATGCGPTEFIDSMHVQRACAERIYRQCVPGPR